MKIQDAIPILLKKEKKINHDDIDEGKKNGMIKVWVSDMCLHLMESQVDLLLLAKREGLLSSKTFFVLTLKCVVGRSKESFDTQVEKVVEKLYNSNDVTSIERMGTYHLFSNRSGERTIMGYLT